MKNIYTITVSAGLALLLAGCGVAPSAPEKPAAKASDSYGLDVAKVCDAKTLGAQSVLDQAIKFNPIAVKKGIEFRRHAMNNSVLIEETQLAINSKATEVKLLDDKMKSEFDKKLAKDGKSAKDMDPVAYKKEFTTKVSLSTDEAAIRACKFAISALQQEHEAETQYKEAIPGMGYKY
ncbi:MAG: hypothetical protein L0Y61_08055 [Epsilonproteobacteria bacterium]|nr:hypothetical protein [Campylobacterota bacterium]